MMGPRQPDRDTPLKDLRTLLMSHFLLRFFKFWIENKFKTEFGEVT
jgi:hypothetical protein